MLLNLTDKKQFELIPSSYVKQIVPSLLPETSWCSPKALQMPEKYFSIWFFNKNDEHLVKKSEVFFFK